MANHLNDPSLLEVLNSILCYFSGSSANSLTVLKRVLKTPSTRRALGLGCLLQLFQQFIKFKAYIFSVDGVDRSLYFSW